MKKTQEQIDRDKKYNAQKLWEQMTPRERLIALKEIDITGREALDLNKKSWYYFDEKFRDVLISRVELKILLPPADLVKIENRQARKLEKVRVKEFAIVEAHKAQQPVKSLTITIEYKKSYMWGYNPHASVVVEYHSGEQDFFEGFTASGCGYCKQSTVIAEIFNKCLRYELYRKIKTKPPYGLYYYGGSYKDKVEYLSEPTYNGGVGTSCYTNGVAEFIGGKFENIASGKSFDVFVYTDKKKHKQKAA